MKSLPAGLVLSSVLLLRSVGAELYPGLSVKSVNCRWVR